MKESDKFILLITVVSSKHHRYNFIHLNHSLFINNHCSGFIWHISVSDSDVDTVFEKAWGNPMQRSPLPTNEMF